MKTFLFLLMSFAFAAQAQSDFPKLTCQSRLTMGSSAAEAVAFTLSPSSGTRLGIGSMVQLQKGPDLFGHWWLNLATAEKGPLFTKWALAAKNGSHLVLTKQVILNPGNCGRAGCRDESFGSNHSFSSYQAKWIGPNGQVLSFLCQ